MRRQLDRGGTSQPWEQPKLLVEELRAGHESLRANPYLRDVQMNGQSNTIFLIAMPRGRHTVRIEAVDPEGKVFTKQTVTFNSPGKPR